MSKTKGDYWLKKKTKLANAMLLADLFVFNKSAVLSFFQSNIFGQHLPPFHI
jgi:hypothetical protein